MACFLDMKGIDESVERGSMKYTKSVLGLNNQVNSNRLRVILNRPLDRHMLWVLLRKNMRKYRKHFQEDAWIYNIVNNKYEIWMNSIAEKTKINEAMLEEEKDYSKYKKFVGDCSLKYMAVEDNLNVSDNYRDEHKKKYYMAWDKRDSHMIRYLVNHGFYKHRFRPKCEYCGEDNSRGHVTNKCPEFTELRNRTWKEIGKIRMTNLEMEYNGDLEKALLDVYFKPSVKIIKELEVVKSFAINLTILNCRKSQEKYGV